MKSFVIKVVFLLVTLQSAASNAIDVKLADIATYQRSDFNRVLTECDRIGAHPADPEKVGQGIEREDMDLTAVIKVCHEAVKDDSKNPRLNYQLARAYGYSGQHAEGDVFRMAALKAGYPQSLFVFGYIRISGWDGKPADPCYGGELVRLSALTGRVAGLIGFPHYALTGVFDQCSGTPRVNYKEIRGFLDQAKQADPDYYQQLLIEHLEQRLALVQSSELPKSE